MQFNIEGIVYAKNLSKLLHQELSFRSSYETTTERFESLRRYDQLPRGRERAAQRLSNEEVAAAILGFVSERESWAGHVALCLGDLRPVGGVHASFLGAETLKQAIARIFEDENNHRNLVSLTLSIAQITGSDEYHAKLVNDKNDIRTTYSYVSKYALSLSNFEAEKNFDHERPRSSNTRQLVLDRRFFQKLKRALDFSRQLNKPLQTDWSEYKTEEEISAFRKKLGAKQNSNFLHYEVNTDAAWPHEPTRMVFEGRYLVLFPKTKEQIQSICIDLHHERITMDEARTLISRFLSLLSWCDDSYAILGDGWSGSPVPISIPRGETARKIMNPWIFDRKVPTNEKLLQCLAYYREGLNAHQAGLTSLEVLSFYKVIEKSDETKSVNWWIKENYDDAIKGVELHIVKKFEDHLPKYQEELEGELKKAETKANVEKEGEAKEKAEKRCKSIKNSLDRLKGSYLTQKFRVATAHRSSKAPSDPDISVEIDRLSVAAIILHALARHFITSTFKFSNLYWDDDKPTKI